MMRLGIEVLRIVFGTANANWDPKAVSIELRDVPKAFHTEYKCSSPEYALVGDEWEKTTRWAIEAFEEVL